MTANRDPRSFDAWIDPLAPVRLDRTERYVVDALAEAWNAFQALDDHHPDALREFRTAIHSAQLQIAARVAKRVDPDAWR